jgi:anionic cell wall polymer biosynthesis LytR-Cps2A-Psr (LCP) family protein
VDAIGGIEIDVPYDIYDYQYPDMYHGFDPFIIRRGVQRLDGATALKFARTRNTDNDFERARRQQMVLFALRDQVLDANTFPQLVVQSPNLLASMSRNVYTSLSLDEILQFALYLRDIPTENIHTGVADSNYSMGFTTQSGAAVLIPQRQALGYLMTDIFGEGYSQ